MTFQQIKCPNCGGEMIDQQSGRWSCKFCGRAYLIEGAASISSLEAALREQAEMARVERELQTEIAVNAWRESARVEYQWQKGEYVVLVIALIIGYGLLFPREGIEGMIFGAICLGLVYYVMAHRPFAEARASYLTTLG